MEEHNNETWKPVAGYEGLYEVSDFGRVRSVDRIVEGRWGVQKMKGRLLKQFMDEKGYLRVKLSKGNCEQHTLKVHRLVCDAFLPNPYGFSEVNHINETKTDNRACNLEWCDRSYNVNYGSRIKKVSKRVFQYTISGDFVAEWPSTMEIQRELGLYNSRISECCLGKRDSYGGFRWAYNQ